MNFERKDYDRKEKEEIFSNKILCGSRTYFFDIKQSKKGDYYFKISEKRKVGESTETHQLMIFDEDIDKFADAFNNTFKEFRNIAPAPERRFTSFEERPGFKPWTPEEEDKLKSLFAEGKNEEEIAEILDRRVGAIISKGKKLGLITE